MDEVQQKHILKSIQDEVDAFSQEMLAQCAPCMSIAERKTFEAHVQKLRERLNSRIGLELAPLGLLGQGK